MTIQRQDARSMRGFTLTEAAIVLGIVGLILGGVWVAAASVYHKLHVQRASEAILTMVGSLQSMHANQQLTIGINELFAAQAGAIPGDLLVKDVNGLPIGTTNAWGGSVEIATAADRNAVPNRGFSISFNRIPVEACTDLLVRGTGVPQIRAGLHGYSVAPGAAPVWGAGPAPGARVAIPQSSLGITLAVAGTLCQAAAPNGAPAGTTMLTLFYGLN